MLKWLGSEGTAGVMDKDAGPHVWNYAFDRYELKTETDEEDPNTVHYDMDVFFVGSTSGKKYSYSITYENGKHYHDLYAMVYSRFQIPWYVAMYLVCFLFLGFHLLHAFQSAFQTLGLNHKNYTPFIKKLGVGYTLAVVAGFMVIPLFILFTS